MGFLSIVFIIVFLTLYQRYFPVQGVKELRKRTNDLNSKSDVIFLDTRDYQTSSKEKIDGNTFCIPLPYLKRHYVHLPIDKDLIVINSDRTESYLSIRLLRKKGFRVVGYFLPGKKKKEEYRYGIQCSNEK